MKTYEIHNLTTNEILADNLSFEDVPELFEAYSSFYMADDIIVCYRESHIKRCRQIIDISEAARNQFKSEWTCLIEELINLGNLYQEVLVL